MRHFYGNWVWLFLYKSTHGYISIYLNVNPNLGTQTFNEREPLGTYAFTYNTQMDLEHICRVY